MHRCCWLLGLALLLALTPLAGSGEPKLVGKWKVTSFVTASNMEVTDWVVALEEKDGKLVGDIAGARLKGFTVKEASYDKAKSLRIVFKNATGERTFQGVAAGAEAKRIRGVLIDDTKVLPAELTATEEDKVGLNPMDTPALKTGIDILRKAQLAAAKAKLSKDAEVRKGAAELEAKAAEEAAGSLQEVLDKQAESIAAVEAATLLIRDAGKTKASADKITGWIAAAKAAAAPYGSLYQAEVLSQLSAHLVKNANTAKVALTLAQEADATTLKLDTPASLQTRVLTALAEALRKADDKTALLAVELRLEKLLVVQDQIYLAKLPKLQAPKFEPRKGENLRVAVMELFTGSECPPCVAADVAFDFLQKSFATGELVLLQYHMHIPGPDPMTNRDTESRWAYYAKKFPMDIRGTPSTLFNGTPKAGGGGAMANALPKYNKYRELIEPLLEEKSDVKMKVRVVRKADKLMIHADVNGVAKPSEVMKVRFALVEETVRFAGGNGLRLHHQVVRAFIGGADGIVLSEKDNHIHANITLSDLRNNLTAYLDEYASTKRPFPRSERPMAFKDLRVVAFVQDDLDREILQAVQVDVPKE